MKTIAVVGLGLIGGSVLKGLKPHNYKLIGVARRQETIDEALKEGIISEGSTDIGIIKDADVIFVCTPINKTISMIKDITKFAKPEAIITDVASIKGEIMNIVNANDVPLRFIGGHPMAGTENKGLESSFPELYQGAKWVLTPSKWIKDEDIEVLKSIIEQLGAETIIADPKQHDKAVALISHMPLLLSQALFSLIEKYPDKTTGDLAMKLAASGFRDMTRLAATNPDLSRDMLCMNKTAVLQAFKEFFEEATKHGVELVEDEENFSQRTEELAAFRKKMYSVDGKNLL